MLKRFDGRRNDVRFIATCNQPLSAVGQRQRPKLFALNCKAIKWTLFERRMKPNVCRFVQPKANFAIRRRYVDQVRLPRLQRCEERFAQVTMEAFNLAFRLRSIWSAQLDRQSIMPRKLQQIAVVAMTTIGVSVSLYHDGLRIVAKNVFRYTAKEFERTLKACDQCFRSLVISELDKRIASKPISP
jgi:hypothetical protein